VIGLGLILGHRLVWRDGWGGRRNLGHSRPFKAFRVSWYGLSYGPGARPPWEVHLKNKAVLLASGQMAGVKSARRVEVRQKGLKAICVLPYYLGA
jgi:hypothetical protein